MSLTKGTLYIKIWMYLQNAMDKDIIIVDRESQRSGYPHLFRTTFSRSAVTSANSGGYFRFPLKTV